MSSYFEFHRLDNQPVSPDGCYVLDAFNPPAITADADAVLAMTDLSKMPSATIMPHASLEEATQSMILRGVRLLLVVDDTQRIVGVVTSADLLGEKPVQIAQKRQLKRTELRTVDVMTPVDMMETLGIEDVKKSCVGDIVATLKSDGRAHALVVGYLSDGKQHLLGIFSASQIARQLGVQVQTHEMARTFAEIEAVLAGV